MERLEINDREKSWTRREGRGSKALSPIGTCESGVCWDRCSRPGCGGSSIIKKVNSSEVERGSKESGEGF